MFYADLAEGSAESAEARRIAAEQAADDERLAGRGELAAIAAITARARGRRDPGQPGSARCVPGQSASPAGGYGTWRFATGIPGQRAWLFEVDPIAIDTCDHRFQAAGHDPGTRLRHLSQVRHATCTAPMCRRPSTRADFEHNRPYEAGGRSCLCNGGPPCKR